MTIRSLALAALLAAAASSQAASIAWNTWASATTGSIATANGPVAVSFAGPATGITLYYPSFTPGDSYADGALIGNPPSPANGVIQLIGGSEALNTVTFATAVVDPVMVIWSLGQPGLTARFDFIDATPSLVHGGPNAEYGGESISVAGSSVSGAEGNGTLRFKGTFTTLSWKNPIAENWYGFNVGTPITAPVPEPAIYVLMLLGLVGIGAVARRRRTLQLV